MGTDGFDDNRHRNNDRLTPVWGLRWALPTHLGQIEQRPASPTQARERAANDESKEKAKSTQSQRSRSLHGGYYVHDLRHVSFAHGNRSAVAEQTYNMFWRRLLDMLEHYRNVTLCSWGRTNKGHGQNAIDRKHSARPEDAMRLCSVVIDTAHNIELAASAVSSIHFIVLFFNLTYIIYRNPGGHSSETAFIYLERIYLYRILKFY